jgi:hypothetical protein
MGEQRYDGVNKNDEETFRHFILNPFTLSAAASCSGLFSYTIACKCNGYFSLLP